MKELILTDENWALIQRVNTHWNREIDYAPDREIYKKSDYWNFPKEVDGHLRGDCEDYAIAKKMNLWEFHKLPSFYALGWCYPFKPIKKRGYHAVLMIHAGRGAYVLDNRFRMVYYYKDCGYKWHKIEMEDGSWQNFS
jgi:predicted transglutaminase-like cysteine proteinase